MPLFSVIIVNYNHAAFLKQRIDSVLQQSFSDFEVIFLDDCSTDNSREIIESYRNEPKVSTISFNEKNSGSPFVQWKKGVELAKGKWIWLAESDDIAKPTFLEEAFKTLTQYPSSGVFYCDAVIMNNGAKSFKSFSEEKNQFFLTNKWSNSYFSKGETELNENLKFICTINNASSVVFKKEFFEQTATKLDEFVYHGDWYFYLQLSLVTDICYSASQLNVYRKHPESHLSESRSIPSLVSRKEYFLILQLLYHSNKVKNKKEIVDHFCFHYLSIGFFSNPLRISLGTIRAYFKIDRRLAWKVIPKLFLMKLFRKKYKRRIKQFD